MSAKPHLATSTGDADKNLAAFEGLPVAVISDAVDALGLPNTVLDPGVRLLSGKPLVGRARTISRIKAPPNATQPEIDPSLGMGTQKLIDSCQSGDVVVIAAEDNLDFAMWGDNMGVRASSLGVRGVVTDGAVRDLDEMPKLGLSVYARGTTPKQAFRRMLTLTIDQPIVCGGVMVRSGDVVIGDADGVVVVPHARAAEVAAKAREIHGVEATMQDFIRAGNSLVSAVEKFKAR
jgi:4-hydroxy-4-methyl-2-oxoglutarate aldolase